ncbi:hypothetical protein [Dasania marina]|uniref:hypothetical protein n=1 Tax=Dasania marina TaxID=471499 RepID=UPI0030D7F2F0|tara:strand:+ start:10368 stop:10622 length:255 start_codon:yes stop_codon:yes gene_type:complete
MNTTKYSAEEFAIYNGVPVCLINYYAQIGLLGEQVMPQEGSLPKGLELVDYDEFIQCATKARLSDEEIQCLLQVSERAEAKTLC